MATRPAAAAISASSSLSESAMPAGKPPELPLDHDACILANLRTAHANSGSAVPFEIAVKNNLVRRCLENAVHAANRKFIGVRK